MISQPISALRQKHLIDVDNMPPELRMCVHEFGYTVVSACLNARVSCPRRIRQLVHEVWRGAREHGQRPAFDDIGKSGKLVALDWVMIQAGAAINAATLVRVLRSNGYVVLPLEPTKHMVEASMEECSSFTERVTKREKHLRRLRAATRAACAHLWPHLGVSS